VTDIPVAVWDADHSELSRLIVRSFDGTRSMNVVMSLNSVEEIREQIRRGKIQGALYLPSGLEKEIKKGKQGHVVVYKNSFNLIIGNSILKDATAIVKTVSAGVLINKFRSAGMMEQQALALANPIRLESYNLFNPNYNYEVYFVPCLVMAMFQMLIMVTAVTLLSSEHHDGSTNNLFAAAGSDLTAVLVGKPLPYLALHTASTLFILGIIFPLFGIPIHGSVLLLVAFALFGNAAVFYLGFMISALVHNQLMATEIAVFLGTPAVLFSGYTFPVEAMPVPHALFAHLLPFTYFFSGFIKIYQYGTPLRLLGPEFAATGLVLMLSVAGSWLALRHQRKSLAPSLSPDLKGVPDEA
jgi:ABC-2 type transport system permease protein